jgi:hypothetical protein
MKIRRKETIVVPTGERVQVYSADGGNRWFSDRAEAEQCEKARQKFLQQSGRALKKMSTFSTDLSRPIGRPRRTKQEDGVA